MYPGHEHEANGEFAGESGNLHWGWWKPENRRFSLILQAIEKSMRKTGEIKKPNGVSVRQRDKKWWQGPGSNW